MKEFPAWNRQVAFNAWQ